MQFHLQGFRPGDPHVAEAAATPAAPQDDALPAQVDVLIVGCGPLFGLRGIHRARGALVVVRPDQYVAHVLPLQAHAALAAFFDGFMLPN